MDASETLRLDLACGQACTPGFEGVDLCPGPGVKYYLDLFCVAAACGSLDHGQF